MDTAQLPEGVPEGNHMEGGHGEGDGRQGGGQDKIASFGSIDCTEESLAKAFNKWKEHGAGYYAGKGRSEWAQGGYKGG